MPVRTDRYPAERWSALGAALVEHRTTHLGRPTLTGLWKTSPASGRINYRLLRDLEKGIPRAYRAETFIRVETLYGLARNALAAFLADPSAEVLEPAPQVEQATVDAVLASLGVGRNELDDVIEGMDRAGLVLREVRRAAG
jgi:hypothetical protein